MLMRQPISIATVLLAMSAASARSQQAGPSLAGRIFADFNYLATERPIPSGFREGQLALHLAATLSDRLSVFGETTASASSTGFSVEAERFFLRYDHGDLLKLSAGRFHTPTSYWNTAFHHGSWMQTSVARPDMVRGGSGLSPLHFVGVLAEGMAKPGPLGLGYTLGVGNGRHTNIARSGDAGDANKSRAVLVGTTLRLPLQTGMKLGAAYYMDRATPSATIDDDEGITSVFFAREKETPEVIVEYSGIVHNPRVPGRPSTRSSSYYGQIAYRLPGHASSLKPYARVERTIVPAADEVFAPLKLNYDGRLGGIRFDLAPTVAIKLEYRGERFERGPLLRTLTAQLSFTFPDLPGHSPPAAQAEPDGHEGHASSARQ